MVNVEELIRGVVESVGLGLFDIELPATRGGALRVFLMHQSGDTKGVLLDHCAQVHRILVNREDLDGMFPGGLTIEVSSPGINRRLRTERHFSHAVGERVRVTFQREGASVEVVGLLKEFCDGQLAVEQETPKKKNAEPAPAQFYKIPLGDVRSARVDFKF